MAVRIPIVTVFDSKGLKQAQYQLNKVRGNFQNLGRNFAIAGAALAGGVALIGKSLRDAAESQKVFAQTEAVLKSTGTTANGTAKDIQALASSLQKSTAFNDEAILSGANLLLTFKNIQNQAGETNDIFDQTVRASLDVARAMGTDASGEAIRLGKALNDPVKGISALTRVGIQFTDQQKEQIKTLTASGDLLGAQKIILAELQSQFGGSAAAYAQTFAGQVEGLNNELNDLSEEIGFMVMPAVRDMIAAFREVAPELGTKLKAAIASVDWKAFGKTLVDTTTFLIQNADAIVKVVTALFTLNTAYNTAKIAVGLFNAAAIILGNTFTVTAGKIGLATGALKLFKIALITTGIGALIVALGLIVQGATEVDSSYRKTTPVVTSFGTAVLNSGKDAEWAAGKYGTAKTAIDNLNSAAAGYRPPNLSGIMDSERRRDAAMAARGASGAAGLPDLTNVIPDVAGAVASAKDPTGLAAWRIQSKQEAKITKRENRLISKGLGADVAANLASSGLKTVTQALNKVNKNGSKAVANLTRQFQNSAAGQAAAAAAASAAAEQAAAAAQAAAQAAAEQAAREAAIVAERQRVYESFASSVASTFASIKESILGAFSLPELGGSTDSIIRNMDKLLARVKAFSANITQLSSMGLDPRLLQQVINAGPMAGAKLAANLVSGGVAGLSAINAGYAELGTVAGEIGMTGTQAQFGTSQQQQIINVNISGGLDSAASIGKAVVDAVRAYERTSGAVWQGA
ncbi:hypothetical protein UFOVP692_57 [uncultured Caudovirales phage]|uniref:Uncharacterized protein n=1 Tax=uncultured Caudovirales phage TaxID=2100421 RepID=A0A6J5NL95_9CAUD|nr:hypothetical protein UFOVP692_57 [uncultured Caudovirales phage]